MTISTTRICAPLLSVFLAACSGAGLFVANAPSRLSSDLPTASKNFSPAAPLKLDIFQSEDAAKASQPVVIFFHGGRWARGKKEDYSFVGATLRREGLVVAIPDYRKKPQVTFQQQMQDAATAVAWVQQNIAAFGGDPQQIFLMGHSSGAHMAALLASNRDYLTGREADVLPALKGFVGMAGPYDFTPQAEDLREYFGPPEDFWRMQVSHFIDGDEPPMLLLHGGEDQLVAQSNLQRLVAALQAQGKSVQHKIYPQMDHAGLVASLTWMLRGHRPVLPDIMAFIQAHSSTNVSNGVLDESS